MAARDSTLLAIDQGGTKTAVLIGDPLGNILGAGYGDGACFFGVGLPRALECINQALNDLHVHAGLDISSISRVCAGMSGANWPDERETASQALNEHFGVTNASVTNDCVPALYGGSTHPDAVVLCAGSGFNVAVLTKGKLEFIYNNYIEAFDSGGSGIAQRALVAVFRTDTHMGPPTSLRERALEFFDYPDVLSLLLDYDRHRMKKQVKDFAYCVDEEAVKGDAVARDVQTSFARSVTRYASAAIDKYGMRDRLVDVVLSGGAFKARSGLLIPAAQDELQRTAPNARVVNALYEPVVGAYIMALEQQTNSPLTESQRACIEDSARQWRLFRQDVRIAGQLDSAC